MKYTVSYSRKVRAGQKYEFMEIFASAESDTGVEPMDTAFERVRQFVDDRVEIERDRLLEKGVKRPEAE